jgi:flagellar hook assembly protein FlgD
VAENVRLVVYNLFGQKIRTLVDGLKETGSYRAMWDGKDEMGQNAAAGVYLYRITTDSFTETRKMLLIK